MHVFDEQYSQALVNAVDSPVFLLDYNGQILMANNQAFSILEREPETIIGAPLWQYMESTPAYSLQAAFESFDPEQFPLNLKLHWRCSRSNCWANATLAVILLADGPPQVMCTITQMLDSYSVIEGMLHAGTLEQIPQPICVTDENDVFRYCNKALRDLVDRDFSEIIGIPGVSIFSYENEEEAAIRIEQRHKGESETYESTIMRPNGELVYVIVSASPIMDSANRYRGAIAFITDMTSQKLAEQELRRSNTELDAFSHTVAHDLKSPLSVLLGFADLLETEIFNIPQDDAIEYLRTMGQTTQKMINIVDELLLLSQMRKSDVTLVPVDMEFIVNEALMGVAYLRNQHRAQITVATQSWPKAMGYPAWIEAVWSNYISNAIKYGGEPPHIEIGATEEGDWIRYWVRDDGEGLTQEQIGLLFKPFERLHTERTKGHGIGLTIVQRIMVKLGGEVGVESMPGEGSIFSFRLRRALAVESP